MTGRLAPGPHLARALLDHVRPVLAESGELPQVTTELRRMTTHGGGAEQQRAAYARRADLRDVVDFLTGHTTAPAAPRVGPRPGGRARAVVAQSWVVP